MSLETVNKTSFVSHNKNPTAFTYLNTEYLTHLNEIFKKTDCWEVKMTLLIT